MNTAFLLTGQSRSFEYCFPSIKRHVIDALNPDIYIVVDGEIDRFTELYRPAAAHLITPEEDRSAIGDANGKYTKIAKEAVVENNVSLFWKWKKCDELMAASGKSYDAVIMGRPDVYINGLSLDFVKNIEANALYFPKVDALGTQHTNGVFYGGWGGQLTVGPESVAHSVAKMYDDMDINYRDRGEWHTERMFMHHCARYGIKQGLFDIDFKIVRLYEVAKLEGV